MALNPAHISNFETMRKASKNGDLALLECTWAGTEKTAATIVVAQRHSDGGVTFLPIAVMLEDPFKELNPPEGASYAPL